MAYCKITLNVLYELRVVSVRVFLMCTYVYTWLVSGVGCILVGFPTYMQCVCVKPVQNRGVFIPPPRSPASCLSPDGGPWHQPWSGGNGVRVAGYGGGRDFSVYTVIVYANIISLARVKFEAYPVLLCLL